VILLPLVSIGDCDLPTWSISEKGVFNCEDTWEVIRHRHRQVQWWKLIWFSLAIPRQAFFMWLAIRDSLTTGESLLKWVFGGNALCGIFFFFFGRSCIEGRNHLFFECGFSKRVRLENFEKCLIGDPSTQWEDIVDRGVKVWKCRGLKAVLFRLCLSATVYNLWQERNSIRHGSHLQTQRRN
jgi:hypothetical protein